MNGWQNIQPIILAAGKGNRMQMKDPKPLVQLAGKPLVRHIAEQLLNLGFAKLIVVIPESTEAFYQALSDLPIVWVKQPQPQGTGDALRHALQVGSIQADQALVLFGDTPLIQSSTLLYLLERGQIGEVTGLSMQLTNPFGYGRIVRDQTGQVLSVVEENDASIAEKRIREVNSGVFLAPVEWLKARLPHLKRSAQSKEYCLTELFSRTAHGRIPVKFIQLEAASEELLGLNTPEQLAQAERLYQLRTARQLAQKYGIRFQDLNRFDLRGSLVCGQNVSIDANVCLEGNVTLEAGVKLGAGVILRNSYIGEDSEILPYSIVVDSQIGQRVSIGPFAHIRPGTQLADQVSIGNFVEVKASALGVGTKARHLSYLGDSQIDDAVNIGAGVITCNYDGERKHRTRIAQGAFIGSNTSLVAPVQIGSQSFIGAGTVITKNVGDHQLVTSRVPQCARAKR